MFLGLIKVLAPAVAGLRFTPGQGFAKLIRLERVDTIVLHMCSIRIVFSATKQERFYVSLKPSSFKLSQPNMFIETKSINSLPKEL